MRLIKKADTTVAYDYFLPEDFYETMESLKRLRIISNGREAVVIRE